MLISAKKVKCKHSVVGARKKRAHLMQWNHIKYVEQNNAQSLSRLIPTKNAMTSYKVPHLFGPLILGDGHSQASHLLLIYSFEHDRSISTHIRYLFDFCLCKQQIERIFTSNHDAKNTEKKKCDLINAIHSIYLDILARLYATILYRLLCRVMSCHWHDRLPAIVSHLLSMQILQWTFERMWTDNVLLIC